MKKEVKFEKALQRLEIIVEQLESGEVDLDKSIKIFEEGNDLVKLCLEKLNSVGQKIKKISADSEGIISLEDFE
jgi:exodeoxyribonuclease VII small subunit